MKLRKPHLFALTFVCVWGVLAFGWMGSEDGSGGFSPFGWTMFAFFFPAWVAREFLHIESKVALVVVCWLNYSGLALATAQVLIMIRKALQNRLGVSRESQ